MIEVYADNRLVYNSRFDEYKLLGLETTSGLNKAGTAQIVMPPDHPAYSAFVSFRTVVTLWENGILRFRGRALYPTDDFHCRRTITCEGERGFFQDSVIRPYLFQDSPAAIFEQALNLYNADVEPFKRFSLGVVTVTDPNGYVRIESSSAEKFSAFFDKLVERCGGYIVFTDDGHGGRAANWFADIGHRSGQSIEFGENLLDFSRNGQSAELATAIRPYGALLEDGTRVTIESVTEDGSDWIQNDEAVALRGTIIAAVTWDDVTEPYNLLKKAEKWLDEHRKAITSLQLTAVDLSRLGLDIDGYTVGDLISVKSKPHQIDDDFRLTDRATNWLNPAGGNISLGKAMSSLTGADVEGDRKNQSTLEQVKREVTAGYKTGIAAAQKETTRTLTSLIEQEVDNISMQVSEVYEDLDERVGKVEVGVENVTATVSKRITEEIGKIQIGARNLIRNSRNLIFEDYFFAQTESHAICGTFLCGELLCGQ